MKAIKNIITTFCALFALFAMYFAIGDMQSGGDTGIYTLAIAAAAIAGYNLASEETT